MVFFLFMEKLQDGTEQVRDSNTANMDIVIHGKVLAMHVLQLQILS